ncbi:hypothetical protein KKC47_00075 [Patescibacteria group bacterium]|nr:hypothetical protein [Patescibacteria group bacterium]
MIDQTLLDPTCRGVKEEGRSDMSDWGGWIVFCLLAGAVLALAQWLGCVPTFG